MGKYRKLPVVIEATQWNGGLTSLRAIEATHPEIITSGITYKGDDVSYWSIKTLEGQHRVSVGDWIIKGVNGEFYPCKPDIFLKTYELA